MGMAGALRAGVMALTLPLATAVAAQEASATLADGLVTISGGIGVVQLEANELAYDGGQRLSQLIWSTANAPVLNASFSIKLPADWVLSASGAVGIGGDSYMVDYDWIWPFARSAAFDDWSDRSQHPDTDLDFYFTGEAKLGRIVAQSDTASLTLHGGLRYTDVKWSAYGGSYVYSYFRPRDTVGDFPEGEPGISYQQRLPVGFVGADIAATAGAWSFGASASIGMTFAANDVDNHWQRDLLFEDSFEMAPVIGLGASIGYALSDRLQISAATGFDKVFTAVGDTTMTDLANGDTYFYAEGAGADFQAMRLSLRLDGRF